MNKIKFKNLTAEIDSRGAQLRSFKKDGKEILWQGSPEFWTDTAPLLFPICGGLVNDTYLLNGNKYTMPKHGFAKDLDFKAEYISENSIKFIATENDWTLNMYPYKFELCVIFTLLENALKIDYKVVNKNNDIMYYSIGSHEGYNCEDGFKYYDVIFNKNETFEACQLDEISLSHKKEKIDAVNNTISLKNEYFEIDAIILENINSDVITLRNRNNGSNISVEVGDFENLLIWTMPNAPYVCIEPWSGFPDYSDTNGDFTAKHSIQKIEPNGTSHKIHTIKVEGFI